MQRPVFALACGPLPAIASPRRSGCPAAVIPDTAAFARPFEYLARVGADERLWAKPGAAMIGGIVCSGHRDELLSEHSTPLAR